MQAPRIPKMFGIYTKQPNRFDYTPRYYNEQKEKFDKRVARIEKEVALEQGNKLSSQNYNSTLQDNWGKSYKEKATTTINKRVLIYLVVLLGLAYYLVIS